MLLGRVCKPWLDLSGWGRLKSLRGVCPTTSAISTKENEELRSLIQLCIIPTAASRSKSSSMESRSICDKLFCSMSC